MKKYRYLSMSVLASAVLAGCGSSSSESEAEFTAIDGYLRNAQAWVDLNNNGALDANEPTGRTNRNGKIKLKVENGLNILDYPVIVRAIPGETTDYDPDTQTVREITSEFYLSAPLGQKEITPLTTLVRQKVDSGLTLEEATKEVADLLGLPEEDVLGDFFAKKKKKAAKIAVSMVASEQIPTTPQELSREIENVAELEKIAQCSESIAEDSDAFCDDAGAVKPRPEGKPDGEETEPEPEEPENPEEPGEGEGGEEPTDPGEGDQDPGEGNGGNEPTEPGEGDTEPTDPGNGGGTDPEDPADPSRALDISALNDIRSAEFGSSSRLADRVTLKDSESMLAYAVARAEALVATGEFTEFDYSVVTADAVILDSAKDIGEIRYLAENSVATIDAATAAWAEQGSSFDINAFDETNSRYITACSDSAPCYNYAQIVTGRATEAACVVEPYAEGALAGQSVVLCTFNKTFIPRYRAYNQFQITSAQQAAYVDTHNTHRANHTPTKPVFHSEILEMEAQDFADVSTKLGLWRHSKGEGEINPDLSGAGYSQGENLWKGGSEPELASTVNSYYLNEINNFVDDSGTTACKTGRVCGHASQVAWQETRLVGCATSFYGAPLNGENQNNWLGVCRYYPAGNYSGKKFFCPSQGEDDILFELPHLPLPYTADNVIPFTDAMLAKRWSLVHYQQDRSNAGDCSITKADPATLELYDNYVFDLNLSVYSQSGGAIKPVTGPYAVEATTVSMDEIGQMSVEGPVLGAASDANIKMTYTILDQRDDGSYIVEISYDLHEDLSRFGGNERNQSKQGIYLMTAL